MQKIFELVKNNRFAYIFLVILNAFTWYPALNYWFFRNWEQSYLVGHCGAKFDFICMMKSHGLLYFINYKLFGWNAWGWYLTAIILFTISALLVYKLTHEITKNRTIAFIAGTLFSVNVAHNDVVLWGSFEGLYAILMISFLLGVLFYKRLKEDIRKKNWAKVVLWHFLILVFYSLSLFIRENAVVMPGLILIYEWYTNKFRLSRNYIVSVIKIFMPMAFLTLGYLWLRQVYGGSPNDFIDSMVRLRISLWRQGLWGEYVLRTFIYFGKFAGSHVVPYPFMNTVRQIVAGIFNPQLVNYWFFTIVGTVYVLFQVWVINYFKKHKRTFFLLCFSFLWFLLPTVFYSLVFSLPDNMIIDHYDVDTTRWRYFAFFGTVLFCISAGWRLYEVYARKKEPGKRTLEKIVALLALSVVVINFILLRSIQKTRYEKIFKPAKDFYTSFQKDFSDLPEDFIFYGYTNSHLLSDYLTEWYAIREVYNPNLVEERNDWGEGNIAMLLKRIRAENLDLSKIFFLDHTVEDGLVNKTEEARDVIRNQTSRGYTVGKGVDLILEKQVSVDAPQLEVGFTSDLPVEIPYDLEVRLTALNGSSNRSQVEAPLHKASALLAFNNNLLSYTQTSSVEVCATAPLGSLGLPAEHLLPVHLNDGNLGGRSVWTANCWDAWVVVDLGSQKTVTATAFHTGVGSPGIPAEYEILVSSDGENWREVVAVEGNQENQRIDVFERAVRARYVKLQTYSTTRGGWLTLDEVFVFDQNGLAAAQSYQSDFEKLLQDSRDFGNFMRLSWETSPYDTDPGKSVYVPLVADGLARTYTTRLNESEIYSHPGDFLERVISEIEMDFVGKGGSVWVESVIVRPRYPINDN